VVLLASFLAAWVGVGQLLAPLRQLRDTTHSITEADLTRRVTVRGRDEVAQIAERFNEMLDRLEAAFETQRRFVDDAGHELRTPITIVRGHLELLSDDAEDRHETVALVLDELDRMSRMVDDLLLLANAEKPDFLHPGPVDVEALTRELHTKVTALAPRAWRVESTGRGTIRADRQRITQAVMQLAENAARQTGRADVIALGTRVVDGEAHVWVRDTGQGIPYDEQPHVFDRFVRGSGNGRADGAGLGLSIVDAIARAHGGRVELSSRPGAGATFTLVIPGGSGAEP
jgi:signal transduction histidine kinase